MNTHISKFIWDGDEWLNNKSIMRAGNDYMNRKIKFDLLSKKERFLLIKENPLFMYWVDRPIENCSLKLQIFAIRQSGYDKFVIRRCPSFDKFPEKVLQEILDNLTIKDIIE